MLIHGKQKEKQQQLQVDQQHTRTMCMPDVPARHLKQPTKTPSVACRQKETKRQTTTNSQASTQQE